jgi:hypothetical protein
MANEPENLDPVKRTVLFTSEYLMPGGSNLVQGNITQGGLHIVLGLVARSVFGLPGLLAVSANSFSKAVTGRHLHEHLGLVSSDPVPPSPTPSPTSRNAGNK